MYFFFFYLNFTLIQLPEPLIMKNQRGTGQMDGGEERREGGGVRGGGAGYNIVVGFPFYQIQI